MAANNSGTSRSRPQSFLSRVPASKLKSCGVTVKRTLNNNTSASTGPIERSIDDPTHIIPLVHIWNDERRKPGSIFDRDDILVNPEEQFVPTETDGSADRQTCPSGTPGKRSRTKSRGRTVDRDRYKIEDKDNDMDRYRRSGNLRRSIEKECERFSDTEKDKRSQSRCHSKDRKEERCRRSRTPLRSGQYRPSHSGSRYRSSSRDRHRTLDRYSTRSRRSKSLSVDYHKPSTFRKPSRSPRRSVTPSHDRDTQKSARYETSTSRRSRSPIKPEKAYHSNRGREPSPGYKDSGKRRSKSPSKYERRKRRSRSRSSLGRHERYPRRRYSRSPGRYDDQRPSADKRRRSPYPPRVNFSSGQERSSREYHKYRRSRSRTPSKRSRTSREEREAEFAFYEGIPGSEYWIPNRMRPGFPTIPRCFPPVFFSGIPGAPIVVPPRMPMVTPYRQTLPVYNSKQKLKVQNPAQSIANCTVSKTGGGETTDCKKETRENCVSGNRHIFEEEPLTTLHEKD